MSDKIKIVPKVIRLIHLIDKMDKGEIKIPSFQRDYIWTKNQKKELFESIQEEYPIGAILLWKPDKKFKINDELGPFEVKEISPNGFFYILDGFQRLSTLFGCLINPQKTEHAINKEKLKEFTVYYNLEKEEFDIPNIEPIDIKHIPLYLLIDTFGYLDFADNLRTQLGDKRVANELIDKAKHLSSTLIDYEIPLVEIHGGSIEKAVNIFSRVNSKGSPISKDWMVSALTSNESEDFNLGELIENLLDDLALYNFQDLKREVILQCVQTSFGKIYFDTKIDDLIYRDDFIEKTKKTISSIKRAVEFLFEELLVLERRLLPYNNQLIFISYFFNEIDSPTQQQKTGLKDWFWITTYANYFTIYSLSKIRSAFEQFKDFVKGENNNPVYNDRPDIPFTVVAFPDKINFGSVRSSAFVLFLLNFSNDFKKIDTSNVEGMEIYYLFSGSRNLENIVAIIKYFKSTNNKYFKPRKYKDVSFLVKPEDNNKDLRKIFITTEMVRQVRQEVLQNRKFLITKHERKFVEQNLGMIYTLPKPF